MAKYIFNDKEYYGTSSLLQDIENELDIGDAYDDLLDDVYGDIKICGLEYSASIALSRVDEVAYRCGKNDYISGVLEDITLEIEGLTKGDIYNNYNIKVECVEDDLKNETEDKGD